MGVERDVEWNRMTRYLALRLLVKLPPLSQENVSKISHASQLV